MVGDPARLLAAELPEPPVESTAGFAPAWLRLQLSASLLGYVDEVVGVEGVEPS